MRIFLSLPIPSKKNSKRIVLNNSTGKPTIISSKAHNEWYKNTILWLRRVRRDVLGHESYTVCQIKMTCNDASKRKYDLSNKVETIMDAIVDAGIIVDDNRFCVTSLTIDNTSDSSKPQGWEIFIEGKRSIVDKGEK